MKDWSDVSTSHGMPKMAGKLPEARKSQGRISLQVSERAWPYKQLVVKLLASRT